MIGFKDLKPMCKEIVVTNCIDCPFCDDVYMGGDYQLYCHALNTNVIGPIAETVEERGGNVMNGCPLKKNHIYVRLDGFPPEEDWV